MHIEENQRQSQIITGERLPSWSLSLITKINLIIFTTANDSPDLAHRHLMMSSDLGKRNHIENNTWLPVDMEFLFYRVKHSKTNSISTSHHVLYCLSIKGKITER